MRKREPRKSHEESRWCEVIADSYKVKTEELLTKVSVFKDVCLTLGDLNEEVSRVLVKEVISVLDSILGEMEVDGEDTNGLFLAVKKTYLYWVRAEISCSDLRRVDGMREAVHDWISEASDNGKSK